ncbi:MULTISPECIES: DUF2147 domain-containing protein [unclassified Moraxella]|uniref:DUF2147 domain-containing protein n=1 Tax=unclassified Moraxella TaxID=2685852 RepID=UPI003AF6CCEC
MLNLKPFLLSATKKSITPLVVMGLLGASNVAVADPIEGHWVYYDNQKPKYVVTISQTAQGFVGVLASGSKYHIGETVLSGISSLGNGKYSGGKAYNPYTGSNYDVNLTLNGDTLSMRAYKGLPNFGISSTLQRLPKGYTFKNVPR